KAIVSPSKRRREQRDKPSLRACEKIGHQRGGRGQELLMTAGCGRRAKLRAMFWAMANHVATDLTFSRPRTMNCRRPRLRAWALTHSAVAALSLSIFLAFFVPIRFRHPATSSLSVAFGSYRSTVAFFGLATGA